MGFMADSTQSILAGMPENHEIGEPDLYVWYKRKHILSVEVTGSGSIGDKNAWLRLDKVDWAIKHKNPKTWAWWVFLDKELIKPSGDAKGYPVITVNLKGRPEQYHTIPQSDMFSPSYLEGIIKSKLV